MKKMLAFEPRERITVAQALKHPYLSEMHLESDEPMRDPIPASEFEFEDDPTLTAEQLKDILYEEILLCHFEDFRKDYETRRDKG
jgi:mitogen-activated protein kinase 1/3